MARVSTASTLSGFGMRLPLRDGAQDTEWVIVAV